MCETDSLVFISAYGLKRDGSYYCNRITNDFYGFDTIDLS